MTSPEVFQAEFDVSRETMARFDTYVLLLKKWTKAINLVARSTTPHIWERHLFDCAQVFSHRPKGTTIWVDLGSGAGFPGLVVAILATQFQPNLIITCIESDQRKAAFLRTVIRELDLNATVMAERVEDAAPMDADIVSARALAPLPDMLPLATRHLKSNGTAIFLKGASYLSEIDEAKQQWAFDIQAVPSKTGGEGAVLILGDIRRA